MKLKILISLLFTLLTASACNGESNSTVTGQEAAESTFDVQTSSTTETYSTRSDTSEANPAGTFGIVSTAAEANVQTTNASFSALQEQSDGLLSAIKSQGNDLNTSGELAILAQLEQSVSQLSQNIRRASETGQLDQLPYLEAELLRLKQWFYKTERSELVLANELRIPSIIYEASRPMELAADLLARDIGNLSGQQARTSTALGDCMGVCIVIGTYTSPLISSIAAESGIDLTELKDQWERYKRILVRSKDNPAVSFLVIAGSDTRGTVWGVVDLTRELGVSAWEWWADVAPRNVDKVVISGKSVTSESPSVQYRGIFLNDEDFALLPWAAKNYEKGLGNIGPKTYARVFELMWRLKANTIWPAMHDVTTPFFKVPGNAEVAREYAIVVSSSHAEPMLRNNVGEWNDAKQGQFNYITNAAAIIAYWWERVELLAGDENIWTLGLRSKHDSRMLGVTTDEQGRDITNEVFRVQRDLLVRAKNGIKDLSSKIPADVAQTITAVPQIANLYKEVLNYYRLGLEIPEDVIIGWPDDNYGYMRQLSNAKERERKGGSGLYYHLSYWGSPHDYLWLGTTHPALVREQMDRAWKMQTRKVWIFNVGDIKPAEYLTQYSLDMAFDHKLTEKPADQHLRQWLIQQFGMNTADEISSIMMEYYDLAWERRPEFMGPAFSKGGVAANYSYGNGAEAWRRIDRYAALMARAQKLAEKISPDRKDAYFQLVLYPVRGAASLNERILKLALAETYKSASRASMNVLSQQAKQAQDRIFADTAIYNSLNNGKWNGMMNRNPRDQRVFWTPNYPIYTLPTAEGCAVDSSGLTFVSGKPASRTLTVYSFGRETAWSRSGQNGLELDLNGGSLNLTNGFEQRIVVKYSGGSTVNGGTITCGGKSFVVKVSMVTPLGDSPPEIDRIITIPASSASHPEWEVMPGLGGSGSALRARLDIVSRDSAQGVPLSYSFRTGNEIDAELRVVAVPVHALTSDNKLRIAVRLNGGSIQIHDYEALADTTPWSNNVLSNMSILKIPVPQLSSGKHTVEIFALDPGIVLDRIEVRLKGAMNVYGYPVQ